MKEAVLKMKEILDACSRPPDAYSRPFKSSVSSNTRISMAEITIPSTKRGFAAGSRRKVTELGMGV